MLSDSEENVKDLDHLSEKPLIEVQYAQSPQNNSEIAIECSTKNNESVNETARDLSENPSGELDVMLPQCDSNLFNVGSNGSSDSCSNDECNENELPSENPSREIESLLNNSQLIESNVGNAESESFILPDTPSSLDMSGISTVSNDDSLHMSAPLFNREAVRKKQPKNLKSAKKKKSADAIYTCDVCQKEYSSSSSLIRHCRIHTGEKPYICPVCSRGFTSNFRLKSHYLIHTGVTPYICKICMKGFRDKSDMIKHELGHTGVKPFVCDICNKGFLQKCLLQSHYRCHTGLKPFPCDVCGKCFAMKRQLQVHFRIHTGEKPYSCNVCVKTFNLSGNLKKHYRTHTGEKPYTCDVCKKSFSDGSSLTKHKFIHLGRKPHACNVCEKSYTKKSSLDLHFLTHIGSGAVEDECFQSTNNYSGIECVTTLKTSKNNKSFLPE